MVQTDPLLKPHHATPSGKRLTSSILSLLLLVSTVQGTDPDTAHDASTTPAWAARQGLASLPATNVAHATPVYVHPARRAIGTLSSNEVPEQTDSFTWGTNRTIAGLGEGLVFDESTLNERMEFRRVQALFRTLEERGDLISNRVQAAEQMERLLDSLTFDSSRFYLHHRLGALYFREQDYRRAAVHMENALNLEPNNAAIASNLAAAQMTLGQLNEALDTLNRIQVGLVTSPQLLFSIYFNKACLNSLKGRTEDAIENLIKAVETDPPSTLASLGDPQLDFIREDIRFKNVRFALESMLNPR